MSDTVGAYFRGGGAGELGKKKEGALRSLQRPHRLKNKQIEEWQSISFFFCPLSPFQERQQMVSNYAVERQKKLEQKPPKEDNEQETATEQDKVVFVASFQNTNF